MAVLGIVTCEILELEFAQLLGTDPAVGRISVLENRHSARLIELLEARQVRALHRLPHISAFRREPGERLEVMLRVLEIGLHRNAKVLRTAVTRAAHELSPNVDAFLLGYGRCGNAFEDARTLLDVDKPVFLPLDRGQPVDDCVALCLGGRDCYYAEQCKIAGTFFLTPGWSRHWKEMLGPQSGKVTLPGVKRILSAYERALLVQTPALPNDELLRRGEDFARQTGLRLEVREGTLQLLTTAWEEAKHLLLQNSAPSETGLAQ